MIASHRIVCQRCVYRLWKKLTRRNCNKIVGLTSLVKKTMKNKVVIVLPWKSFLMILSLTKQLSPSPLTPPQALRFLYRSERETRIRPFPLFSLISWKPLCPRHRLLRRCFFRAEMSAKREWRFTDFVYFISWPCARSRDHTCMCVDAQSKTSEVTSGENVISFKTAGNIAKQSYFETTPWPRP